MFDSRYYNIFKIDKIRCFAILINQILQGEQVLFAYCFIYLIDIYFSVGLYDLSGSVRFVISAKSLINSVDND